MYQSPPIHRSPCTYNRVSDFPVVFASLTPINCSSLHLSLDLRVARSLRLFLRGKSARKVNSLVNPQEQYSPGESVYMQSCSLAPVFARTLGETWLGMRLSLGHNFVRIFYDSQTPRVSQASCNYG